MTTASSGNCYGDGDRDLIILCQFAVVSGYRSFFEHLARINPARRIHLVVPAQFTELGNQTVPCEPLRAEAPDNLVMTVLTCFAPHVQIMILPGLVGFFRVRKKDTATLPPLLIAMVEPYSVSFLWMWLCLRLSGLRAEIWGFTCQNIFKPFRWPLSAIQQLCFRTAPRILACGIEQQQVLRQQGFLGAIMFFPFWYDESRLKLDGDNQRVASQPFNIGFCGKIAVEKGVFDIVDALRLGAVELRGHVRLCIAGGGPDRPRLEESLGALAAEGFEVEDSGALAFERIPEFFAKLDVLLVPSRTQHNWKEQFGRVIVEAMACGVTVLGSDSGEIPHVIGDPDRVFREADPIALADCLKKTLFERSFTRSENSQRALVHYSSAATARALAQEIAGT